MSAARWPPRCPGSTGPLSSPPNRPCSRAVRPAPTTSRARAFATARQGARDEGIFSGPSTGANLAAALDIAGRLGPGHRVVTLQVDSGLKYLAGPLYS